MDAQPQNSVAPKIYGLEEDQANEFANKNKSIQAIVLENYCKPDDFVRVINILDEVFYWQVLPIEHEHISISGDQFSQRKEVRRDPPKLYSLMPKATGVFRGYIAAKMVQDLVKKLRMEQAIQKKANMPGVKTISADWYDYSDNVKMIEKIFLGVENPTFDEGVSQTVYVGESASKPENTPTTTYKSVEELAKELGISDDAIKTED